MAQIKPKTNKNIVTVGELKKKRAEKLAENAQMEGMMKVDGESDPEYLKRIAANNASISKYNKIIANPQQYKPKNTQYNTGGKFGDIYVGPKSQHPGLLKAKSDKLKAEQNLKKYKAKSDSIKKAALEKMKSSK